MGLWSVTGCAHLWRTKQPVITMIHFSQKRSGSKCLAVALVGLGLVVFLWGFAYKVSLYCPQQTLAAHILKARFFSEERNTSRTCDHQEDHGNLKAVLQGRSGFNAFFVGLILPGLRFRPLALPEWPSSQLRAKRCKVNVSCIPQAAPADAGGRPGVSIVRLCHSESSRLSRNDLS